jgi:Tfp pilus assembly protein PilF
LTRRSKTSIGRGIYYFNKTTVPDFQRSRDFFERMLQKDPQNARAWTGVAMSNLHLGAWGDLSRIPFAKAAALKAIELDDSLAEPHAELGMLSFHFEWNIPEAERQLRRAIELNPNYYRAHSYYSIMLAQLGRSDEAHEQFRQENAGPAVCFQRRGRLARFLLRPPV